MACPYFCEQSAAAELVVDRPKSLIAKRDLGCGPVDQVRRTEHAQIDAELRVCDVLCFMKLMIEP
jgi:hypothetical protein